MNENALIPLQQYGNDLAFVGEIANQYAQSDAFAEATKLWTLNTKRRYMRNLELFSDYLAIVGIVRTPETFFNEAEAWRGMSFGLLKGFRIWLEQQGYATGTITGCISAIRVFCRLAGPGPQGAGVISEEVLAALAGVKVASGRKARNLDEDRKSRGIPVRKGHKKATPTRLTTAQALNLKRTTTTQSKKGRSRDETVYLAARDSLMLGLFIEHALRCSEVQILTVESIDLWRGMITVYRPKTDHTDIQRLHRHTRLAAEAYLQQIQRTTGPLFFNRDTPDKPLSLRAINKRVGVLGEQLGIEHLSPHDLRHYWAFDALLNKTPLNVVMADGGWLTEYMPLRYAHMGGEVGGNATISEEN